MQTIFNHKSIRKYKKQEVSDDILNKILSAATRASNTGNMQMYSIVVTKNEDLRKQLCEAHFNQKMVLDAPLHLTFCADINRFNKWCKLNNAEPSYDNLLWLYNASIDAVLASQNACLEAEYYKLGICYLGTALYSANKIIDILNLPKGVLPVVSVVVGYPDEEPELTDRLPLSGVVHSEKYEDYSDQDIKNIFAEKENLPFTKQLIEENKTENLAQIFTEKRYKKDDNIHFSDQLLKVIKQQGLI